MTGAESYTGRPVGVRAKLFRGSDDSAMDIVSWIRVNGGEAGYDATGVPTIVIKVPEGQMKATPGFYVVWGPTGVFRSMRADEFGAWLRPSHETPSQDAGVTA